MYRSYVFARTAERRSNGHVELIESLKEGNQKIKGMLQDLTTKKSARNTFRPGRGVSMITVSVCFELLVEIK